MTDREKLGLRGPVHTVLTSFLEYVHEGGGVAERPRRQTMATFNRDGSAASLISNNQDGSISRTWFQYDERGRVHEIRRQTNDQPARPTIYEYDSSGRVVLIDSGGPGSRSMRYEDGGRRIESQLVPRQPGAAFSFGIEGARGSYACEDAHELTTVYDAAGRAHEMLFHDHAGRLMSRVALTWDPQGRLVEEAQYLGDAAAVEVPAGVEFSAEQQAAFARVAGAGAQQSRRAHFYDAHSRRVESVLFLAGEFHERETYAYDERDLKIAQAHYNASGALESEIRYEREVDTQGNWVEERVLTRSRETEPFAPVSLSRRTIVYYQE